MIIPEYEHPVEESQIIHCDDCREARFRVGQRVVTIKNYAPVVLTITGIEYITCPGYPDALLEGVDSHGHAWHAYSDNCLPYTGDVICLSAQNHTNENVK